MDAHQSLERHRATRTRHSFRLFTVADTDFSQGDLATLAGRKLAASAPDLASGEHTGAKT